MYREIFDKLIYRISLIYKLNLNILILLMLVISIFFGGIIYINYTRLVEEELFLLQSEELSLKQSIAKKYEFKKSVGLFINQYPTLLQLEKQIDIRFNQDNSSTISLIHNLVQSSGLVINNIVSDLQINEYNQSNSHKIEIITKQLNLQLVGSYSELNDFMVKLSILKQLIQIKELKINRVDDDKLDISIVIIAFYLK